jgi:hypothetical protein
MKSFKLFLVTLPILAGLAVTPAFPQTASSTTTTASTAVTEQTFDTAYWAHQPPAVAALAKLSIDYPNTVAGGRTSTAIALATQGYTIDNAIDVWGWDPYQVMSLRQQYGYTWVPSLFQPPVQIAPGLSEAGLTPYNPNAPPAGSITVSLALSAYPPFNPPAPVVPVSSAAPASCVGSALGAGFYAAPYFSSVQACALTNGLIYTADPRGYFTFHVVANPFGNSTWFSSASGT